MKKIAVIGSKGFIGSHLVEMLKAREHEVVEIDLPGVDICCLGDLLMNDSLSGVDVVYHLAVLPLPACGSSPRNCVETNIMGTVNVMEAAKKYGVKRVIYASASSVYGDPEKLPVKEDDPKQPVTLYGASKLASENIIHTYSRNFDLTCGIFRFTNVYGEGQRSGLIPSVISSLLYKQPVTISGTGEQTRDFVYVNDVVGILLRAMDHPLYSFTTNLGSGSNESVNTVVRTCADLLDIDIGDLDSVLRYSSPWLKYVKADNDRKTFRADLSQFRRLYGSYYFTDLQDGLSKTIEWWKSRPPQCRCSK